jgi:hypothetical protein
VELGGFLLGILLRPLRSIPPERRQQQIGQRVTYGVAEPLLCGRTRRFHHATDAVKTAQQPRRRVLAHVFRRTGIRTRRLRFIRQQRRSAFATFAATPMRNLTKQKDAHPLPPCDVRQLPGGKGRRPNAFGRNIVSRSTSCGQGEGGSLSRFTSAIAYSPTVTRTPRNLAIFRNPPLHDPGSQFSPDVSESRRMSLGTAWRRRVRDRCREKRRVRPSEVARAREPRFGEILVDRDGILRLDDVQGDPGSTCLDTPPRWPPERPLLEQTNRPEESMNVSAERSTITGPRRIARAYENHRRESLASAGSRKPDSSGTVRVTPFVSPRGRRRPATFTVVEDSESETPACQGSGSPRRQSPSPEAGRTPTRASIASVRSIFRCYMHRRRSPNLAPR